MKNAAVLIAVIFMLLNPGKAVSEISQHFDHHGRAISHNRSSSLDRSSQVQRYSLPEGVELHDDVTYEFYPVFGKTFAEIVSYINENGPINKKDRKRYPSRSEWTIGWSYEFEHTYIVEEDAGVVHVAVELYNISIIHDITITLPTLIDTSPFNPIERNLWKNFFMRSLDYEHAAVNILKDPAAKSNLSSQFSDISYYTLKSSSGMDIEREVRQLIKQDTMKIGQEWVNGLIKKIASRKRDSGEEDIKEEPASSESLK